MAVLRRLQVDLDTLSSCASSAAAAAWVQVRDREEAAHISNAYAPEHLIINVDNPESWLPMLDNAGSIFMGR
jgi:histidinol dehydrogenase